MEPEKAVALILSTVKNNRYKRTYVFLGEREYFNEKIKETEIDFVSGVHVWAKSWSKRYAYARLDGKILHGNRAIQAIRSATK